MRLLALLLLTATPGIALDLQLPNGVVTKTENSAAGQIRMPDAAWSPDSRPALAEGEIQKFVITAPGSARTPLQLLTEPRAILAAEGYQEVFTCASAACGGFDFRFDLDIIGEPHMHVDLGDYLYVLSRKSGADPHTVALLASRSGDKGFVHVTFVSKPREFALEASEEAVPVLTEPATPDALIASLLSTGRAVLGDLDFGSGSATLNAGSYRSLQDLADWLAENPSAQVVLVGHTDSIGSLEGNTGLSRQRAAAAVQFLVDELGVDESQLQSSGIAFFAPLASNLDEDGRAKNRRVEVVLLSVEQ